MNYILLESQDGKFIGYCKYLGIGMRKEKLTIGDELKELLNNKKINKEEFIKNIGNSYRDNIERILDNTEIPKSKMLEKIINYFDLDTNYFKDKELENVIVTDNNVIVGTFSSNILEKVSIGRVFCPIIFSFIFLFSTFIYNMFHSIISNFT